MLAKIKDTTKASDDEIGRNLMGLARARPDVFGERPSSVHPWSGSVHPQSARKATLHASLPAAEHVQHIVPHLDSVSAPVHVESAIC